MNVAYVSLDEVNEDQARRLARANGLELELFWPTQAVPPDGFPVVIYDLDYLPAGHCDRLPRRHAGVVAAHGYNLTRRQRAALRRRGVLVARRLGARLLARVLDRAAGGAGLACVA